MRERFVRAACVAAIAALAAAPSNAAAAPSGLAWDSVTKLAMGADISTLQPGAFDQDFAAASSGQSGGGGFLNRMMGGNMQQLMNGGLAERHYVAGSMERTDVLTTGTATIVDCAARTITTLDLRKKTYRVRSMDQTAATGADGAGGANPRDNGMKLAISVNNTALGARQIAGEATTGYSSQVTITVTDSSGASRTQNGGFVAYYANFATPAAQCPRGDYSPNMPAGGGPASMATVARLMRALSSANADKRFSVTQSGPALPLGSFAMYQAMSLKGGAYSPAFITERGNVRPLNAGDPVFSVPSDFTKEQ